jgi:uncharacterized protein
MPVKLVRYTYKTSDQEWNRKATLTTYQQLVKDNFNENVVKQQQTLLREDPVSYEDNVSKKVWYFETAEEALSFWNVVNDMNNEFVKAYKNSTSNSVSGYVQHKIETKIEQIDGTVIATIQAKQA